MKYKIEYDETVRCDCCGELYDYDNYKRPGIKCFSRENICPACRKEINSSLGSRKNKFITKEELKNQGKNS